jgi:O-antigen biosynthesis protein
VDKNQIQRVSIVIPTYNGARWLTESVRSALAQDYPRLEILVVDDGSTDATTEIVNRFDDPRLRYIRKEHTGQTNTRNYGILHSEGDFIVWLDSDDVLLPGTVEKELAVFETFTQADVVYGDVVSIDAHGRGTGRLWKPKDYWGLDMIPHLIWGNQLPHPGTMVRREIFQQHGLYDERFVRAQDYELWSRVADKVRFKHAGCQTCKRRIHDSNVSGDISRRDLRGVDTTYEMEVVRRLVERFPLQRLFPDLFRNGEHLGRCRAYLALASISQRWKDRARAKEYFRRALWCSDSIDKSRRSLFRRDLARFVYGAYITSSPYCYAVALAALTRFPRSFSLWRRFAMTAVPNVLRPKLKKLKERLIS